MSDRIDGERNDEVGTLRNLWRTVYRHRATVVGLCLILVGVILILVASQSDNETLSYDVFRDIGIASLIAGSVGFGFDLLIREHFLETLWWGVRQVFIQETRRADRDAQKGAQFRQQGLENIYNIVDWGILETKFVDLIAKAPELIARASTEEEKPKIRILQTWMSYYHEGIIDNQIKAAAKADCKVEILLLNPYSRQVIVRGQGLRDAGYPPQDIKFQIKRELIELRRIYDDLESKGQGKEKNLEVRVYEAAPAFHLYDFNGNMIMGVAWRDFSSIRGPQFEIVDSKGNSEKAALVERIDSHFNALWNDKSTIEAEKALARVDKEAMARNNVEVATIEIDRGKFTASFNFLQHDLLPKLREQKGFKGIITLGDRGTNRAMTVTLWDSEDDLQTAYNNRELRRVIAQAQRSFFQTTTPVIADYELLFEEVR